MAAASIISLAIDDESAPIFSVSLLVSSLLLPPLPLFIVWSAECRSRNVLYFFIPVDQNHATQFLLLSLKNCSSCFCDVTAAISIKRMTSKSSFCTDEKGAISPLAAAGSNAVAAAQPSAVLRSPAVGGTVAVVAATFVVQEKINVRPIVRRRAIFIRQIDLGRRHFCIDCDSLLLSPNDEENDDDDKGDDVLLCSSDDENWQPLLDDDELPW
uniref:Uncharacterized protein n=1 Tax=Romanomermis culicivorax TaxID=13658 RepID=A0A915KIF7_ROMCU